MRLMLGFGAIVDTLLGTPASHMRDLLFKAWLCSRFQLPEKAHPGRQQGMDHVLGSLPPT